MFIIFQYTNVLCNAAVLLYKYLVRNSISVNPDHKKIIFYA